ncbi:hypothetical protein [Ulvibacter litoralis]|nr:hypothetical protein [Ulvibacter litoralis]
MKTKFYLSCALFGLMFTTASAQFDNPTNTSVQFEDKEANVSAPTGLEIPAAKIPNLSQNTDHKYNPNNTKSIGVEKPDDFSMNQEDGLLENKSAKGPKAFVKDKEIKEEYGRDQQLGDFKTKAVFVNVVYRDHQFVDGDRIRVYVNDDVVQSDILLDSSFRGFDLHLEQGINKIDFQALNQGDSGPNTAELHVYDDNGILVSAYEWNLLTGNKATVLVIKE